MNCSYEENINHIQFDFQNHFRIRKALLKLQILVVSSKKNILSNQVQQKLCKFFSKSVLMMKLAYHSKSCNTEILSLEKILNLTD